MLCVVVVVLLLLLLLESAIVTRQLAAGCDENFPFETVALRQKRRLTLCGLGGGRPLCSWMEEEFLPRALSRNSRGEGKNPVPWHCKFFASYACVRPVLKTARAFSEMPLLLRWLNGESWALLASRGRRLREGGKKALSA